MGKREVFGKKFIYLILVVWFSTEVLFSSTIDKIYIWKIKDLNDMMAYVVLGLLVIQIVFFQKYQIKELALIAIISLPIIIGTLNSGHNAIMSMWIFVVASKYIDIDKTAKISYYTELILTLVVFYLFANGIIVERTIYRGTLLRHSLGFNHPNMLGIRVFLLVVCRCFIRREKFNIFDWSLIVAAAFFVNRVANSKTSFFALVILSILMFIHIVMQKTGARIGVLMDGLVIVSLACNVLSLLLSFMQISKIPLLKKMDIFMSKRFSQCHRTLNYYGIKMFGQDVQLIINRPAVGKYYHFWLDNAYMSILMRYGIIVFLLFSFLYIGAMIMLKDMKQYMLVEIMCLYAIYGIMENNFFSMSQNLFLFLLSYPIYKRVDVGERKSLFPKIKISW